MPYPEWINEHGLPYKLLPVTTRQFQGILLPDSKVFKSSTKKNEVLMQEWEEGIYHIGFRVLRFFQELKLNVKEDNILRLEAIHTGELNVRNMSGEETRLRQGQYMLTNVPHYIASFEKDTSCSYFVSYYPPELIKEFGFADTLSVSTPRQMPESMRQLIQEALHNPYQANLRGFYYQNLIRDLLFIHLTTTKITLPDELSDADIAAVYQADAILSADLSEHYSIPQLSSRAGTNAFKLKKGFRLIFNMGVFGRLLYRRMEQAKVLLETTSKPIKEVAFEAGYDTVAGFITAFRKRFGSTPLEWREKKSGKNPTGEK